jgi:hypothetical protein
MKKLLTLVLALTLVFALAAPANAITGDLVDEDEVTEVDFVTLDIALFTKEPVPAQFGGFSLSTIATNKVYVVNEMAYYGVAARFTEIDPADLYNDYNMPTTDYWDADLRITSDALRLYDITEGYRVDDIGNIISLTGTLHVDSDNELLLEDIPDNAWGSGDIYYLFGQGVVRSKGVLSAELARDPADLDDGPFTIYKGQTPLYRVGLATAACDYNVEVLKSDGTTLYWVGFNTNTNDEVTSIMAARHGSPYEAIGYNTPGVPTSVTIPKSLGGRDIRESTADAEEFAAYEKVMQFFGFNYFAAGNLQNRHFERKASGLYLKDQVAIDLYTGSIVQPDPSVTPPKTGDAASVVGFAMIALALAAMGYVVSRKVRA